MFLFSEKELDSDTFVQHFEVWNRTDCFKTAKTTAWRQNSGVKYYLGLVVKYYLGASNEILLEG